MLSLTRWRPFNETTRFHHEIDRVFGRMFGDWPETPEWSWLPATEASVRERRLDVEDGPARYRPQGRSC